MKNQTAPKKTRIIIGIASLVIAFVAIMAAVMLLSGGARAQLKESMDVWIKEWQSGDLSSLSEGLSFGGKHEEEENSDMFLSSDEAKELINGRYAGLFESEPVKEESGISSVILPYTQIEYKLPGKIKDGTVLEFEITGPDMRGLVEELDAGAAKEELLSQTASLLEAGMYENRTSTVSLQIRETENGYRIPVTAELIDALYGGLIDIVSEAMPDME